VINTNTLKVQAEYLKEQTFTGLAESADGQTLYGVIPRLALPCSTRAAEPPVL